MFATAAGAPCVYWLLGGADPAGFDGATTIDEIAARSRDLPSNHSPMFAPVIEPTLSTGIEALTAAARIGSSSDPERRAARARRGAPSRGSASTGYGRFMDVLVIGAGVVGLTTAISLAEAGLSVTIRTAALPGQHVGGGRRGRGAVKAGPPGRVSNGPGSGSRSGQARRGTRHRGADGGRPGGLPRPARAVLLDPLLTDLRDCEESELPDGFTMACTTPPRWLPCPSTWTTCVPGSSGRAARSRCPRSPRWPGLAGAAPVVVNCSGAAAHDLVPDPAVIPVRGQVVIAANPGIEEFLINREPEPPWIVYMFPHGDQILLGGTNEEGNWDTDPNPEVAEGSWPGAPPSNPACAGWRSSATGSACVRSAGGAAGIRAARRRRAVAQLRSRRRRHLDGLGLRRRDHRRPSWGSRWVSSRGRPAGPGR